jgi:lipopolysaccharide assembly outer membrane protein LptD (OstA)
MGSINSLNIISANADTLSVINKIDTLMSDTTQVDTITPDKNKQLDAPIYYWTEEGSVTREGNKIYLNGSAKIIYQTMTLEAEKIMIDQDNHYLFAEGVVDTIDSLGNPIYKGLPIFSEKGQEPIYGNSLLYDFKTKRGKINYGKTQMPPGYYRGSRINKISDNTLLVRDGYFTSCEYIDDPHFYFRSDKMRVMVNDQIVAQPVYLYIADVPLFVIPFGVFPNKRGRRSGIVVPNYGESGYGGRFLKNFGYYWAPNDYFDAMFLADYYEKLAFSFKTEMNYALRYLLNGRVAGYYLPKDPTTGQKKERWAVEFNHSHTIDPTLRVAASGKFQSDKRLAQDLSSDINRRTQQIITSNLTISKSFKGTKNSMSVNLTRTENLQDGRLSYTIPNIRFSRPQASIYETFTGKSIRGTRAWYQNINFSYNGRMINKGLKSPVNDSTFTVDESKGVEHKFSFNSPQKVLKYFNFSPSLNYQEIWVDEITEAQLDIETNKINERQVKQFSIRRLFNASLGLRTVLYGMFEPNIGSLKFIRHKVDPQISLTFTPDFSEPSYGYYNYVADTTGKIYKIDKFKKNAFSSRTPSRKSRFLRISLGNLFQAKLIKGEEEKKIDLFTLNFSTGYDFEADSLKWRDLITSFRSTPLRGVSLNLSATHSFYKAGPNGSGSIDEFLLSHGYLPRLVGLNANTSFSLDQKLFEKPKEKKEEKNEEEILEDEEGMGKLDFIQQEKISDEFAAKNLAIPWRINFNINYTLDRSNINKINKRLNVGTTASISITKNWRINWTARIDIIEKDIVYQSFSIYRDLHCWEMSFNWQPSIEFYSFQINVKTSVLKDLKVTKHPAGSARF